MAALAAAAFFTGACHAIRAGMLLSDALDPPPELEQEIERLDRTVETRAGAVHVLVFRARDADEPSPGIVLCHGAVDAGAHEARLQAFARALAARGAVVAAPHLDSLARFRIDASDPGRVADVAAWLERDSGLAEHGTVALAGVSVGGSYSLVAADDPAARERVSTVLAFGAYADLERLLLRWMTERSDLATPLFDPLREGRRLVLLGNLERLVPAPDVAAARTHVQALLDGTPEPPGGVPPGAEEVVAVARSVEPLEPDRARRLLAPLSADLGALSPERHGAPRAVVRLLHAASDPVVPSADVVALADALRARGADVRVHRTDLFDHVDARESPGFFESWPLLRFVGGFLADAGL